MASSPPPAAIPTIFSPSRRRAVRARMRSLQQNPDAARFLTEDMVEDVLERLAFLRHEPKRALLVGDTTGALASALVAQGCEGIRADPAPIAGETPIDEEQPLPFAEGFDLIASLGTLETVNDLPGAMVHLRRALRPDGLAVISMMGAGSVPGLRGLMLEADGERPAPRIHPQVDVRAGGQLLQRAGFADPVIDSRPLKVSYRSLKGLLDDLRAQGLGACLQRRSPPLSHAGWHRALAAFDRASTEGRFIEQFEILTLSGWARPLRAPKF